MLPYFWFTLIPNIGYDVDQCAGHRSEQAGVIVVVCGSCAMTREDQFDRIVAMLYEAAVDPALWPAALAATGQALGGIGAQALIWNKHTHHPLFSATGGPFSSEHENAYVTYYSKIDPHHKTALSLPIGQIFISSNYFDAGYVRNSEFYNDFLIPIGSRHVAGLRLAEEQHTYSSIGIQRASDQGTFAEFDIKLLKRLAPHLRASIRLQGQLDSIAGHYALTNGIVDEMTIAIAIVEKTRAIRLMNKSMETLIRNSEGFKWENGRLHLVDVDDDRRLGTLIFTAARGRGETAPPNSGAISATCGAGKNDVFVYVTPFKSAVFRDKVYGDSAALVIATKSPEIDHLPAQRISVMFDITISEAEVALCLTLGLSPKEIAHRRRTSVDTVRSQIKSIHSKLEVNTLAELLLILQPVTLFNLKR